MYDTYGSPIRHTAVTHKARPLEAQKSHNRSIQPVSSVLSRTLPGVPTYGKLLVCTTTQAKNNMTFDVPRFSHATNIKQRFQRSHRYKARQCARVNKNGTALLLWSTYFSTFFQSQATGWNRNCDSGGRVRFRFNQSVRYRGRGVSKTTFDVRLH